MNIYIKKINNNLIPKLIPSYLLDKINTYQNINKRNQSLNAYELLFEVLKRLKIKEEILFSKNGKPYLRENQIYFNLSHSNNYVVLVINDSLVGIDIEKKSSKIIKVKNKFTTNKTKNINKLTKIWTIKEAFIKCLDLTILTDLKSIKIKQKLIKYLAYNYNSKLEVKSFKFKDYYISVAANKIKSINLEFLE